MVRWHLELCGSFSHFYVNNLRCYCVVSLHIYDIMDFLFSFFRFWCTWACCLNRVAGSLLKISLKVALPHPPLSCAQNQFTIVVSAFCRCIFPAVLCTQPQVPQELLSASVKPFENDDHFRNIGSTTSSIRSLNKEISSRNQQSKLSSQEISDASAEQSQSLTVSCNEVCNAAVVLSLLHRCES